MVIINLEARLTLTDKIGYEALTQAAMRGLVRDVLRTTQKNGAPAGDHHFYITFRTRAPGVKIADHLVERFPQEMTIVVQHQFWDLEVHDAHFEIILKFSGVPQHLHIPFAALSRFVDPSVNFGLTFEQAATEQSVKVIAPATEKLKEKLKETLKEKLAGTLAAATAEPQAKTGTNTVVNLDAFRRK